MDIKEIQNLIRFVARSGATEVNLETEEFKINIKTSADQAAMPEQAVVQHVAQVIPAAPVAAAPAAVPNAPAAVVPAASADTPASAPSDDDDKYITVKSPMIGTLYRRPTPEKDTFVSVGDEIKPGDVLCIIEAMKLFNEIESEVTGKVVKVLVDDQTPVEFDQPLFLVDPS
jgi:acetyl-CoA carboxylase biotin carboxyl carrier protein